MTCLTCPLLSRLTRMYVNTIIVNTTVVSSVTSGSAVWKREKQSASNATNCDMNKSKDTFYDSIHLNFHGNLALFGNAALKILIVGGVGPY